jgi:hypothetical protein
LRRIAVQAHAFAALDLNDARLVDDYLDRAEAEPVDCREDLSRHLGRKADAALTLSRITARRT